MLPGISVLPKNSEPLTALPKEWQGKKIVLRITGGVGDALMAVGGCARALKERHKCHVTAAVMPHQVALCKRLQFVDDAVDTKKFNDNAVRNQHDIIIDFRQTFNHAHSLREGEYYKLVENRLGIPVEPGKFDFRWVPRSDTRHVAIHPGSSNPNRRWPEANWRALAWELLDRGIQILWLGTTDEFGFVNDDSKKLSDVSDDLVWQCEIFSRCHSFIGNDSGFAHVAGLLGMPGRCVVFNDAPPTM